MIIFMKNLVWQKFILGTGNLDRALKNRLGGVIFFTKDITSISFACYAHSGIGTAFCDVGYNTVLIAVTCYII